MRSIVLAFIGTVLMVCTVCICFNIHPFEIKHILAKMFAGLCTLVCSCACVYFVITGK